MGLADQSRDGQGAKARYCHHERPGPNCWKGRSPADRRGYVGACLLSPGKHSSSDHTDRVLIFEVPERQSRICQKYMERHQLEDGGGALSRNSCRRFQDTQGVLLDSDYLKRVNIDVCSTSRNPRTRSVHMEHLGVVDGVAPRH